MISTIPNKFYTMGEAVRYSTRDTFRMFEDEYDLFELIITGLFCYYRLTSAGYVLLMTSRRSLIEED